jgi:hypothetical protein
MNMEQDAQEMARAAIELGWDNLGQRDIRELKGHLDGRERLLTGEWARDLQLIFRAKQQEEHA